MHAKKAPDSFLQAAAKADAHRGNAGKGSTVVAS
jgi:hypothetical protein